MAEQQLTDVQQRALGDFEQYVRTAYVDARAKLADQGFRNLDPHFECLRCRCDHFKSSPQGGRCATSGCGHPFFSHDIPV